MAARKKSTDADKVKPVSGKKAKTEAQADPVEELASKEQPLDRKPASSPEEGWSEGSWEEPEKSRLAVTEGDAATDGKSEDKASERRPFPIVGIGASAGGLEALEEFFKDIKQDIGMAFVIISHTDPNRTSLLPDILQRKMPMPVIQVEEGMEVEPNTVYLPPSNLDLILEGKVFHLKEQQRGTMLRLPIDTFFKSLAASRGEQAGCIILSGTGTDGTQGLRIIKEKGGVAMAQTRESARYEGMPESAIATGLVDVTLRPGEMPERLTEYFVQDQYLAQPKEAETTEDFPSTLSKIVTTISSRMGHDFSYYKKSTLIRRVQRRMSVTRTRSAESYLGYLHRHPDEIEALFQDLLIGVTSFFRDPEAFDILRKDILPELIKRQEESQPFRVWVPGCATGEEAYSVVILIQECLDELDLRKEIQVFGTDIDRTAIEKAREGLYPQNIAADVSPARLKRFFEKEDTNFRIRKTAREPVVFAVQNVLKDPPFSKLDLLVCRNLLIYLEARAQKKLLPLFHYALRSGGVLFLGSSETVGAYTDLFTTIHKKWNLYRKIDVSSALQPLVDFPAGGKSLTLGMEYNKGMGSPEDISDAAVAQATQRFLLEKHTPSCVVVNRRGEISYIHGRTGKFLEPAPGRMSVNVIDMAREGLRFELASALRKVGSSGDAVFRESLQVKTNGGFQEFNLTVKPLGEPKSLKDMIVVLFEERTPAKKPREPKKKKDEVPGAADTQRVFDLERELAKVQQDHRTAMEELETSNEELKSVNEELQSSNEELQSTNEELESSREELQSLNEELSTVNSELHDKIMELSQAYDTITHVLNSTRIAILFVDRNLTVLRFTHEATKLINLIDSDVGRPLMHISMNLEYGFLAEDVGKVVSELTTVERQVRTRDGQWYSVRIMPYRNEKGQVDGAILTFINVIICKAENGLISIEKPGS